MALREGDLDYDLVYRDYLRALERMGTQAVPEQQSEPDQLSARYCAHCEEMTMFRLDPEGAWFECLKCRRFA